MKAGLRLQVRDLRENAVSIGLLATVGVLVATLITGFAAHWTLGLPVLVALVFGAITAAGVRIFEWNGPMMHAKTAVADGRWARVGSTNLNIASWMGNWELDVVAEDDRFAREMESMFLQDMAHATEIVLKEKRGVRPAVQLPIKPKFNTPTGSAGRAATGVLRIGNAVGAALTNRRALGQAEGRIMFGVGCVLLLATAIVAMWPRVLEVPLVVLGGWLGISLLVRAYRLRARHNQPEGRPND